MSVYRGVRLIEVSVKRESTVLLVMFYLSQTKIVGTLPLNALFSLLSLLLVLQMLFIAVNSPILAHQHWEGKKTTVS